MANDEDVARLRQGAAVWNNWREQKLVRLVELSGADLYRADLYRADLRGTNFSEANLSGTNLSGTNLSGANFSGTDLSGANLSEANLRSTKLGRTNLRGANLSEANLSGTNLRGTNLRSTKLGRTNLRGANLSEANLRDADLRQATLIDSHLDGANLTGTKLWETQHGGWSIEGVICERVFWDRDGKEPTEYGDRDFERIFAEKPRIVLRYQGGMSPVDLAMLPLIVERLQAEHPDCVLHIRSVQDDGSGAAVTITVDDRADRAAETFKSEVEALRLDFINFQQRLNQEVRQQIEARFTDMTLKLFETPSRQISIGHFTGYNITVEGNDMSRDTYTIHGPSGAIGPHSHAHDMTLQQVWNQSGIDLSQLARELASLRAAMKQETAGTAEQAREIDAVDAAEKAATAGDGPTALGYLKTAGKWALGVAEKIGVAVATKAIQNTMGMPA